MDARDYYAKFDGIFGEFCEAKMKIRFDVEDDDGNEVTHEIAATYEVCHLCRGRGSHVNPSIDAHGITAEEFSEDPDFAEAYFSGRYDQSCNVCNGKRVIPVAVEDEKDTSYLLYVEKLDSYHNDNYCDMMTRRAECGYY